MGQINMELIDIDKKYNEIKLKELLEKFLFENTTQQSKCNADISFALFDKGNFIGGITANIEFETCFLDLLAVDEKYREKKLGTKLLSHLEIKIKEKGASVIILSTQDYQAKEFYLKNNFHVVFEVEDVPFKGTVRYYMRKNI